MNMHANSDKQEIPDPDPSETQLREAKRRIEEMRKMYIRAEARQAVLFVVAISGAIAIPAFIFLRYGGGQSSTVTIVSAVAGIIGLLLGVGSSMFSRERLRKQRMKQLRTAEADFFQRIKRDVHSRIV